MNKCIKCKSTKEDEEFGFRTDTGKVKNTCKKCASLFTKARFYKCSIEKIEQLLSDSNYMCQICGVKEKDAGNEKTKHSNLYIDHDHNTKKLRGVLCHKCNLIIGHANDDVIILEKAIRYLKNN